MTFDAMTARLVARYIDRKQHVCGCITVWDTNGGGCRYVDACKLHTRHALPFSVAAQHPQPKWPGR